MVWNIGTGYFGCRNTDGTFSPANFEKMATNPQIKMIEIKLSQGAKPGKGFKYLDLHKTELVLT